MMNTEYLIDDQDFNIQDHRMVPVDLFPANEKDLNMGWAKQTYNKGYLFSDSITGTVWQTEHDLLKWIDVAKMLVKDIKWNGVKAGRERILQLAINKYNLTLPNDSTNKTFEELSPVNINDDVEIISNPTWYNNQKKEKQAIIHEIVYGITRKVNNFWLIDTEKKWMQRFNIKYQYKQFQRITETRGFVYKLMNSIFSNTTIKMFKRAMLSKLGEFISVRDSSKLLEKNQNMLQNNYEIRPCTFPTGKAYIVKNLNFEVNRRENNNRISINHVQIWVKECAKAGKSIDNVLETIRTMYYDELLKVSQLNKVNNDVQESTFNYKSFKPKERNLQIGDGVGNIGK